MTEPPPAPELPRVRVMCNQPSHRPSVIAIFARLPDGARSDPPHWFFDMHQAMGGGGTHFRRVTVQRRADIAIPDLTDEESAALGNMPAETNSLQGFVEPGATSYPLHCKRCGLRLLVNREDFHGRLEKSFQTGVAEIGLPDLVAILTKQ